MMRPLNSIADSSTRCYKAPTPNIDRLAERGMKFNEAFVENSLSVMKITKGELYKAMCYLIIKSSEQCPLSVRDVVEDLSEPLEILSIVEYENISLEQDK